MAKLGSKFKLTVCAGQAFKIRPIVRPYSPHDRVWLPSVSVFGETPSMFPYKKYVPEPVNGGEA